MPNFHALKLLDMVVGIDVHTMPLPMPLWIHPYFGPIFLWHTPKFPKADVFINGLPACSVGAMGYYLHIPQGMPVVNPCQSYWLKWLLNFAMGVTLMTLTIIANQVIAAISSIIPKPKVVDDFINDVTGNVMIGNPVKSVIKTSETADSGKAEEKQSGWGKICASFSAFTQWQTWAQLLMPPLPYPGSQGSTIVGNPKVTVNGGPIGIVAPLTAMSCSDLPVVPNGIPIGFSNVLVGMSWADLLRGIAVATAQAGLSAAIGKGLDKVGNKKGKNSSDTSEDEMPPKGSDKNAGKKSCKCGG